MSPAVPEDPHGPRPESEVRPSVQGSTPAWEDPSPQLPADVEPPPPHKDPARTSGFTVQPGGKSSIAGTAERIGTAVGNAHREVRRTLELVRRPAPPSAEIPIDPAERANQIAREGVDRAARMMSEIEEHVSDSRQKAALQLDEWSEEAGARLQQLRSQLRSTFARAEKFADSYPLQTIAAIAGVSFLLGVALRLRRSQHG